MLPLQLEMLVSNCGTMVLKKKEQCVFQFILAVGDAGQQLWENGA
jgi:hypothetical protein